MSSHPNVAYDVNGDQDFNVDEPPVWFASIDLTKSPDELANLNDQLANLRRKPEIEVSVEDEREKVFRHVFHAEHFRRVRIHIHQVIVFRLDVVVDDAVLLTENKF